MPHPDIGMLLTAAEIGNVPELDLHGAFAQQVKYQIDSFLQSAWMKNERAVRIVHGKGEGTLLRATLAVLRDHELVLDYRVHETGGSTAVALTSKK
ncbi:MAG: Smr/MutS family protein [bacterium]